MILYMYIAPGQGDTTPWGQTFDVNRKPIRCKFKKKKSDFIHILMILYMYICFTIMYIAPDRGRQSIGDKLLMTRETPFLFDDKKRAFFLCPYVASFKMISSKSDFIHIFNDFIHVYRPGARAENPLGKNF